MNAILTDAQLSPLVSEFETQAQADSYDVWFRAKVHASMNSNKPKLSHHAAVARLNAGLHARRVGKQHLSVHRLKRTSV
jgi:uncharacterized protein (DUF2336 family)